MNKYNIGDIQALEQVLEGMGKTKFTFKRDVIIKYNDDGTHDSVTRDDFVEGVFVANEKELNQTERGDWTHSSGTLTLVPPQYLTIGQYVHNDARGDFRVNNVTDKSFYGCFKADLVHVGTIEAEKNNRWMWETK